jgi:hypothetical protein
MLLTVIPWALYINFHPRIDAILTVSGDGTNEAKSNTYSVAHSLGQLNAATDSTLKTAVVVTKANTQLPILGPVPTDGTKPLYGLKHKGTDAIFALACNYPQVYYQVSHPLPQALLVVLTISFCLALCGESAQIWLQRGHRVGRVTHGQDETWWVSSSNPR